jgi:tripartite-type tricarboxylate transporter receptor subunit TctC
MDPEIVARLHDAFRDALHDPIHRAMIARFDMPIRYLGTEDYRAHVATENEAEKRLMAAIGAPRN